MKRPARCLRARMSCRSNGLLYSRISRPVPPHVLRHTFSITAIQKGINCSPEEVLREFREKW